MPSLETYRKMRQGNTIGQIHKKQSDDIILSTWNNDISSRIGYFYDYYTDPCPKQLKNLNPKHDQGKIPIDIKYLQHTSQTMDKDTVTFHLQFKPGQKCTVPYYQKYIDIYSMDFPLSLYVDIEDESGIFNRWLCVAKANAYSTQFPTYEILPCDYCFQYIIDGKRVEIAGVLRSQNS